MRLVETAEASSDASAESVTLPWPPTQVWPNYRQSHHWRKYVSHVKAQRKLAWALAMKAGLRSARENAGARIPLIVDIYPPDRRRRDRDGMIGACKSILDGVADAIGVDDQYFDITYRFHEPIKGGKIVISAA